MTIFSTPQMENALSRLCANGTIMERYEYNNYLKVSYKGTGDPISDKWNVKIYSTGTVVTTDEHTLNILVSGTFERDKKANAEKTVLQCDDSGWGSPVCGVMVGVSNGREIKTAVVDVKYFRKGSFETKDYLKIYSKHARDIIKDSFKAKPSTHRIEICTGYVNSALKEDLRKEGYDVQVVGIKGFLQDRLEGCYREYVETTLGEKMYYDPKEFPSKKDLSHKYYEVLNWGKKHRPDMLKNGWKAIQNG